MRRSALRVLVLCAVILSSASCGQFRAQTDAQFGDQNFKSAIALIELHKLRFGSYPNRLSDLKFTGAWDQIWISGVQYKKLDDGYEMNLTRGWIGTPALEYPAEFWQGLGLHITNDRRKGA